MKYYVTDMKRTLIIDAENKKEAALNFVKRFMKKKLGPSIGINEVGFNTATYDTESVFNTNELLKEVV
jgi:hypothetical protein